VFLLLALLVCVTEAVPLLSQSGSLGMGVSAAESSSDLVGPPVQANEVCQLCLSCGAVGSEVCEPREQVIFPII